ncbi:MAG: hypothetical protein CMJ48_09690 [Planctomycetaceae bacterium]|nr:hypothetical protein [Planctomycetaceae bacterium]
MRAESLSSPELAEFYSEIVVGGDVEMEPMLQLVRSLSTKPYADSVAVGTSHHDLVIGSLDSDSVSISFWPHMNVFQVRVFDALSHCHETHKCRFDEAESLVESLLLRLSMTRRS